MHKLLLADDSVTIQRVIELTFAGEDVQVIAVSDGEQAIARIPIERPDIVLADIGMPKQTGYDVAAFVKGRPDLSHIPVLLLAGAFERVDEARAEQVKCDGVLVKPFEPRHVVSRVRELVSGAKGSPSHVTADVARPAERLVPPRVIDAPPTPAEPPLESRAPSAASFLDSSLDDYFEKLNAVFEDVRQPAPDSGPVPTPRAQTSPAADSLDGYFDRLSAAFADLAKPLRRDAPPASFDEVLTEQPVPIVEASVGEPVEAQAAAPLETTFGAAAAGDVTHPSQPPDTTSLPTFATLALDGGDARAFQPGRGALDERAAPDADLDGIAAVLSALLAERSKPIESGLLPASRIDDSSEQSAHEALVEEITRRVLDRLVPEVTASLRRFVADELERMGTR